MEDRGSQISSIFENLKIHTLTTTPIPELQKISDPGIEVPGKIMLQRPNYAGPLCNSSMGMLVFMYSIILYSFQGGFGLWLKMIFDI